MTDTWLFVGSSINVAEQYCRAAATYVDLTIITCNSGIRLVRYPDYYFKFDQGNHSDLDSMVDLAKKRGTTLVSVKQNNHHHKWYDILLDMPRDSVAHPGGYSQFTYSGMACMQFACNMGATRVALAGCDGYRGGIPCYFDHEKRSEKHKYWRSADKVTQKVIEPETQKIVDAWKDVEFVLYGNPHYTITADNWSVIPCPDGASSEAVLNP